MKLPKKKKRSHRLLLVSTCLSAALVAAGFIFVNAYLVFYPAIVLLVCMVRGANLLLRHISNNRKDFDPFLPWWWV